MDIKVDKGHYIVMLRGALPPKGILFIVHEHGLLFGLFFFCLYCHSCLSGGRAALSLMCLPLICPVGRLSCHPTRLYVFHMRELPRTCSAVRH